MPKHTSSKPRGFHAQRGFTLIELLIAISIIAIVTGVSVPAFTSYNRRQSLEQAAEQIVSDLRLARTRSVSGAEGAVWGVSFEKDSNSYEAFKVTDPVRKHCPRGCEPNIVVGSNISLGNVTLSQVGGEEDTTVQVVFGSIPGTFQVSYQDSTTSTVLQVVLNLGSGHEAILRLNETGNVYIWEDVSGAAWDKLEDRAAVSDDGGEDIALLADPAPPSGDDGKWVGNVFDN